MIKTAMEYLINKGNEEYPVIEINGENYTRDHLVKVREDRAEALEVSTLSSLVDYVKSNIDKVKENFLIQVVSPSQVKLLLPLNKDRQRENLIVANAILPSNVIYERFIDTVDFNIMLQSNFVDNKDKELLLKFTGLIKEENIRETGDDGVSQKATIKTGVASVSEAKVPNPVILAPYRTFQEVDQPESKFIFRMEDGPRAALFESDGGMWRNEAMRNIHEYLEEELDKIGKRVEIIS